MHIQRLIHPPTDQPGRPASRPRPARSSSLAALSLAGCVLLAAPAAPAPEPRAGAHPAPEPPSPDALAPEPRSPDASANEAPPLAGSAPGPSSPSTPDQENGEQAPRGFRAERVRGQMDLETRLRSLLSPQRMEEDLRRLSATPHPAGSPADRDTAEYVAAELRRAGLQAEIVEYVHYLSTPKHLEAEIVVPDSVPLTLTEDVVPSDPFTRDAARHPGWNAYSGSGSLTAQVVYARHGSREDFATLDRLGVTLEGKILLMHYFHSGEGDKVERAERAGAAAVILYSDPAEDGFRFGDVYPQGPWRPPGSIMRRSVGNTRHLGDPLSPGWASKPGARRLSPERVQGLPRIPVFPVSYRDAEKILRRLYGPAAPPGWQGGLPLTYHLGPGPAEVRLRVEMENADGRIWNVIARIPGRDFPEQWILLGNHRDAWLYGAGDPSSGTAAFLELGRALGTMLKEGWRPRRTILLANFDAEEITLGGAAEWMEEHARALSRHAVAILNMDSAVFNPDRPLSITASGSLRTLWREAARAVQDPRRGVSTYDVWLEMQNHFRNVPSVDHPIPAGPLPALTAPEVFRVPIGDDQTVFYVHLAIPASDMYYGADYGVYHSIYENFHWMKTLVDPDFSYHRVMASLLGTAALRMSESDLLPYDLAAAASDWQEELGSLREQAARLGPPRPGLQAIEARCEEWRAAAADLESAAHSVLVLPESASLPASRWEEWSRRLIQVERSFFAKDGLPGAPWSRNLFAATRFESEEATLPGLRWALEDGSPRLLEQQEAVYRAALTRARDLTRELAGDLRRAAAPPPGEAQRP